MLMVNRCCQPATGKSTCVPAAKKLRLVDDGSIDGFPLSQQQLEDEGMLFDLLGLCVF